MGNSTLSPVSRKDVYQIITDRITAILERGEIPWKRPWRGGARGIPKNLVSRKDYRGINVWMLTFSSHFSGYQTNYWLSFKQAQEKKIPVRKGEKSCPVVFWNWREVEDTNPDTGEIVKHQVPFLRYYNVFNIEQCENGLDLVQSEIPEGFQPLEFNPIEQCENTIGNYKTCPAIYHDGGGRAYYSPLSDEIHIPKRERFTSNQEYYSTLFHECAHSTGHESRLDRFKDQKNAAFGSSDYSQEELTAEFSAAYLCGMAGIETGTLENSAAYIQNWLKALKNNPKMLVLAAARAQKASDYILNRSYSPEEE